MDALLELPLTPISEAAVSKWILLDDFILLDLAIDRLAKADRWDLVDSMIVFT